MSDEDPATEDRHPIYRLESLALVGIGGFAGANLRYLADLLIASTGHGAVATLGGTLLANILGSFALGFVLYEAIYAGFLAPETRAVVSTGFLSSFTTYSTFALQSIQSTPVVLATNVLANYALGFAAVLAGRALANRAVGGSLPTDDSGTERGESA